MKLGNKYRIEIRISGKMFVEGSGISVMDSEGLILYWRYVGIVLKR